jgi:predicted ArsR family transcriptional regulator
MIERREEWKRATLEFLQGQPNPVHPSDVAKLLGVSWDTARSVLLELEAEGKVVSIRTTRYSVYRLRGEK